MINWTEKLIFARDFNRAAHDSIGQKRKYTGLPYWTHSEEVAEIVSEHTDNEDIIIAAFAHDEIEDVFPINPFYSFDLIDDKFGIKVVELIFDLTDIYTKENYPKLNREERKKLEAERLGKISNEAKLIKLADLYSNTKSIVAEDPNFSLIYIPEKERILESVKDGNHELYQKNLEIVRTAKIKLGIQ